MPPPRATVVNSSTSGRSGNLEKTSKNAFTLAEVLITLGIIGVVAAMTMPTLINNTNGEQYRAGFKKTLSALNQAVKMNVALNDYDFATSSDISNSANAQSVRNIFYKNMKVVKTVNGTTSNHMKYTTEIENGYIGDNLYGSYETIYFNDGSSFTFYPTTFKNCIDSNTTFAADYTVNVPDGTKCVGYIDANGAKGPNKVITCDKNTSYNRLDVLTKDEDDNTDSLTNDCTVTKVNGDIFPVIFYNQTVVPGTPAAKAVLLGK